MNRHPDNYNDPNPQIRPVYAPDGSLILPSVYPLRNPRFNMELRPFEVRRVVYTPDAPVLYGDDDIARCGGRDESGGLPWMSRQAGYLSGPITPHLLRLTPGEMSTLDRYVSRLGSDELTSFLVVPTYSEKTGELLSPRPRPWAEWRYQPVREGYEFFWRRGTGRIVHELEALRDAWVAVANVREGSDKSLTQSIAASTVVGRAKDTRSGLSFGLLSVDSRRVVRVSPSNVFSRSWFELLDCVTRGAYAAFCSWCGQPFPRNRRGQRYCPGSSCGDDARAQSYESHPWRREYQRLYQRKRRGTITQEEFDQWRDRNPGPDQWEGADPDGVGTED